MLDSPFITSFVAFSSPFGRLKASVAYPALLFANSEPGVWYDPSDLTTMFQDRAGTNPVTVPGQSVGLILDKSKGLVLGPELVTNGGFDTDTTGWTQVGGGTFSWDASGGIACIDVGGSDCNAQTNITTIAGRRYRAQWTVRSVTGGGQWLFRVRNAADFQQSHFGLTGTFTAYFVASVTGTNTVNLVSASTNQTIVFDNISVREIPGFHAVAISDAARGTYGIEPFGGRRNLLTYTEQFDNAAWAKIRSAVTPNAGVAPDGTLTADKLVEDTTASNSHHMTQLQNAVSTTSDVTASVYLKAGERTYAQIRLTDNAADVNSGRNQFDIAVDLVAGTISSTTHSLGSPINTSYGITSVGNGWHRVWVTLTKKGDALRTDLQIFTSVSATASANPIYTGDGTSGIFIWGAQLETGSAPTNYQRVTTAFDVTEAGVPTVHYVQFDGADDGYATSTIAPGTDKAQVFAGVRKLGTGTFGAIYETSNSVNTIQGTLAAFAPGTAATNASFYYNGTLSRGPFNVDGLVSPVNFVSSHRVDLASSPFQQVNINGVATLSNVNDPGGGNFGSHPLFIGRRGSGTLPFNGRLYSLIVRFGPNLTPETITQMERWVAQRTGVTL